MHARGRPDAPIPSSRRFCGNVRQVSAVRRFIRAELGDHAALDAAVLAASELAANAITHTASGRPGGHFDVCVGVDDGSVTILVVDEGGPAEPEQQHADASAEQGRGLDLVAALAGGFTVLVDGQSRGVLVVVPSAAGP